MPGQQRSQLPPNRPSSQGGVQQPGPSRSPPRAIPAPIRRPSHVSAATSSSQSSTGTVRRIDERMNYGTSYGSQHGESSHEQYQSESQPDTSRESSRRSSTASTTRPTIAPPPPPPPPVTTERPKISRRPTGGVRTGSIIKGRPGFSIDDDEEEIKEDYLRDRAIPSSSGHGTTGYSTFRRHSQVLRRRGTALGPEPSSESEENVERWEETDEHDDGSPRDEDNTVRAGSYAPSEADSVESFTLKARQEAINVTHPFGIRIWKPAIYKKLRSVQKTAENEIHSGPDVSVGPGLALVNLFWIPIFGIWLWIVTMVAGCTCYLVGFTESGRAYGDTLFGLAGYLFFPFGKFIELVQEEAYLDEDQGEGRTIGEYERWQSGDLEEGGRMFFGPQTPRSLVGRRRASVDSTGETASLLGRSERTGENLAAQQRAKRRLFGRGQWNVGRVLFFTWFHVIIAPLLLLTSLICWLLVFTIPMGKVTALLYSHLRRHPLALSFHADSTYHRGSENQGSSILLCTHKAAGWKYYKYTIDGTNIFFINLMSVVVFVILDYFVLRGQFEWDSPITAPAVIFLLALASVIPLAYFIGQAVASISAQSSMGMGATINAFFSTVVEVYLYCIALHEGKGRLVEGSIVGSILAGVLFMPGISMISGALYRKTQRFNARSAGVTSTMLLFAVIGAFAPTLFFQIYGTYELRCGHCGPKELQISTDCQKCSFRQEPSIYDNFYVNAVQPFCYMSALFLFVSYLVGLMFTLRTHAASIWQLELSGVGPSSAPTQHASTRPSTLGLQHFQNLQDGPPTAAERDLRESALYKRVLGETVHTAGINRDYINGGSVHHTTPHVVPPRERDNLSQIAESPNQNAPVTIPGLSSEANAEITRSVAEVAATAATVAAQEITRQRLTSKHSSVGAVRYPPPEAIVHEDAVGNEVPGHDAPNWGRKKSYVILLGATVLYAIVAEILVNTVDVVLENVDIDEKFLGMTLFALVPNTTEFLNAISFAMNGNIALSMEIGSAYALQVCLLQIPALVAWSAYLVINTNEQLMTNTFTLLFPQWDMVVVILCVFLLSYMYSEGKSNYFKGSILMLSYFTVMLGFYYSESALSAFDRSEYVVLGNGSRGNRMLVN